MLCMLTLRQLISATPGPIVKRAMAQCRTKITHATEDFDDFGNTVKECAALVRATDGDRYAIVMFYQPDLKNLTESKIWASCSCPYHCATAGTYVSTSRGLVTIENVEVGDLVCTHAGVKPVTHVHTIGTKPSVEIRTVRGYAICGSETHPVVVLNDDLGLEWKRLQDVKIGDRVAISMVEKPFASKEASTSSFEFRRRQVNQRTPTSVPSTCTDDLAKVLGYLVSEGASLRHRIEFCNIDPDVENDYRQAFFRCFGEYPLNRDPYYHSAEGEWYCQFFGFLGLPRGAKAAQKSIPEVVLQSPKHVVANFLRAYFEGDGSAGSGRQIYAYTISEELARQTQVLLNNFGIVATRSSRPYDSYIDPTTKEKIHIESRQMWTVTINGDSVDTFAQEIGFVSSRKNAAIDHSVNRLHARGFPKNGMRIVRNHIKQYRHGTEYSCVDGTQRKIQLAPNRSMIGLNCSTLQRYLESSGADLALVDPEFKDRLESLLAINATFDEVEERTERQADLFDITVKDHHSYVANGFINHNTFNVEVVNTLKRSSDIINSNGELPVIRNPRMIPHLCKHLIALARIAVKAQYKVVGRLALEEKAAQKQFDEQAEREVEEKRERDRKAGKKPGQKVPPARVLERPGKQPGKQTLKRPQPLKTGPQGPKSVMGPRSIQGPKSIKRPGQR